jgi:hypothetical protein
LRASESTARENGCGAKCDEFVCFHMVH